MLPRVGVPCAFLFSITISELSPCRSGRFGMICKILRLFSMSLSEFSLSVDSRSVSSFTWSQSDIDTIESVNELMFLQKKGRKSCSDESVRRPRFRFASVHFRRFLRWIYRVLVAQPGFDVVDLDALSADDVPLFRQCLVNVLQRRHVHFGSRKFRIKSHDQQLVCHRRSYLLVFVLSSSYDDQ